MHGHRHIATADDEDHALIFVCSILEALKKGNCSNRPRISRSLHHGCVRPSLVFFVDTDVPEGRSKYSDGTLATVKSIVYHGRSRLYTSVTVAIVIYHTSCPVGPRYDKSHSYLHLGV